SDVTRVDSVSTGEPALKRLELPASPLRSPVNVKLPASLGYAAVASPSGDRVYFPRHALGALASDAWFGVAAVDGLVTDHDMPLAPARAAAPTAHFTAFVAEALPHQKWMAGASPIVERPNVIAEPTAVVYRKSTDTILVASEGNDMIAELDARAMDPT